MSDLISRSMYKSKLVKALDDFLTSLPTPKRNIFICRYWYSDSVTDIAKQFHMKENAVSMTLARTRMKLKKYLNERGYHL